MRTARHIGPKRASLRRRRNGVFIDAKVTLKRGADRSIYIEVRAPNGSTGDIPIDELGNPAARVFKAWARRELGRADRVLASVRLMRDENGATSLYVMTDQYVAGVNLTTIRVPRAVRTWADRIVESREAV